MQVVKIFFIVSGVFLWILIVIVMAIGIFGDTEVEEEQFYLVPPEEADYVIYCELMEERGYYGQCLPISQESINR